MNRGDREEKRGKWIEERDRNTAREREEESSTWHVTVAE